MVDFMMEQTDKELMRDADYIRFTLNITELNKRIVATNYSISDELLKLTFNESLMVLNTSRPANYSCFIDVYCDVKTFEVFEYPLA